jgi:hypothetical protein
MVIIIILFIISVALIIHFFADDFIKIEYSIGIGNEYLGLKSDDKPKYLIYVQKTVYGINLFLSFIGNGSDSVGFDTIEEAEEYLKLVKRGKIQID